MRTFKRIHHTGTEAIVTEHADGWRMQINLREPGRYPMTMTGYMAPAAELAKATADEEIAKHRHVCNSACKDWVPFSPERDSGAIQTSFDCGDGAFLRQRPL